jgi:hypothetical protein
LFQYLSASQKPQNKCSKLLLSFLSKILFEAGLLLKKERRRRKKKEKDKCLKEKERDIYAT